MSKNNETADAQQVSPETLLRGNGRIVAVNLVLGVLVIALGLYLITLPSVLRVLGAIAIFMGVIVVVFAWLFWRSPRVAITDSELLVYVKRNVYTPFRIPLDVVEVFFIGQGAVSGEEPGQPHEYSGAVAANVVVRLAESASEWHRRDVHLLLGVWNEGYITIRGLFCANIDQEVLKVMNKKLLARKRQLRNVRAQQEVR